MPSSTETVIITGGTRGLGLATAKVFAKRKARLILTFKSDSETAEQVKTEFLQQGVECHVVAVDLSEDPAPEALFAEVRRITSEVSVYVHNAAATAFKPLLELKPHHIQKTYNITVASFLRNVQLLVPLMPNGGAIVTVSGMDTKEAVPNHGLLGSAKAALEMLTLYFAHELAPRNIRVNGVNPGYLATDSTRRYFGPLFEKANQFITRLAPSHQLGQLEDVAAVIEFLASEKSKWMVGQTLLVDGGQTSSSAASLWQAQ